MQPCEVKIKVPKEVLLNLHKSPSEAAEDIGRQAAIRYYKKRVLSLGKAADLAGMSRFEFIDYLRFNDEPVFEYTDEELEEIKEDAAELEKGVVMSTSASSQKKFRRRKTSAMRSGRLGLRTTSVQAALIQRAAEIAQKSITEFVLTSACEKAEQTLLDQRLFLVDEKAFKDFEDILERPAQVKKSLQSLIEEPAIWEHD